MIKIPVKTLDSANFATFGQFCDMENPTAASFSGGAFTFYRDSVRMGANGVLGFSTLVVKKDEEWNVPALEHHNFSAEIMLPLDDDAVLCLAPACADAAPADEDISAFIVPKGTLVHLNPGVWHYMPLPRTKDKVHVLVVLPERAYHNDLTAIDLMDKNIAL